MYFCFFIYFNFNFFNFFKFFLVLLGHPHTTCPFPLLTTHINISGLKWCIKLHHLSLGMFLFIYSSSIYHSFIFLFIFVLLTSHPFCTPTCTSQDTPPSSQGPKQCIKHVVWASCMFFYLFLFDDFYDFFLFSLYQPPPILCASLHLSGHICIILRAQTMHKTCYLGLRYVFYLSVLLWWFLMISF